MGDRPHDGKRKATRKDVARLANVSTAVVSYVLNKGPKNVSPEATKRVEEAVRILNYHPNSMGKALKFGSAKTFGVIVPDFSNPYFAAYNDAIEATASKAGYSTLFLTSYSQPEKERECFDKLLKRDVDAIFMASCQTDSVIASYATEFDHLIVLDHGTAIPGVKVVSSDFVGATKNAVRHLLEHGHQSVTMLFGQAGVSDPRMRGWYEIFQESNLPTGPIMISELTRKGGYLATLKLLEQEDPPTAIFAATDLLAIGALRALHENRIRIPEDIAVISFDGTVDCAYTFPQLTTIKHEIPILATQAIEAAIHPNETPDIQISPNKLIIRQSCGCH